MLIEIITRKALRLNRHCSQKVVAPPGNQVETEKTNVSLQPQEDPSFNQDDRWHHSRVALIPSARDVSGPHPSPIFAFSTTKQFLVISPGLANSRFGSRS